MITAIDSSVLLDIFSDRSIYAEPSERAVNVARIRGKVVACAVAWAEAATRFSDMAKFRAAMASLHMAAARRSPERQRAYPAGNRSPHSKRPTGATRAKSGEPLDFDGLDSISAELAGQIWNNYRSGGGAREHRIPDFLIGAHALVRADTLLTRDSGFFCAYFRGLQVIY